jgi:hypothetical protein
MMFPRLACVVLALTFLAAPALSAQLQAPPPTFEECTEWATQLAAGDTAALRVLTFGNLPACPDIAPTALADAVRAARSVQDTAYAGRLVSEAARVRAPGIFAAAQEVTADRSASSVGRVMGLLILVAQMGFSHDIHGVAQSQLFTEARPSNRPCAFSIGGSGRDDEQQADTDRLAARTIDGIIYDSTEPLLLRNLARCARAMIPRGIPPQIDVTKLRIGYSCGNRFHIRNQTGAELFVTLRITEENGAKHSIGRRVIATPLVQLYEAHVKGTVEMWHDGQRLATVANAGTECPPR